jgi:hypothetical protein
MARTGNEKYLDKPIIIIGSGRSGTTIMAEIIFKHEDLPGTQTTRNYLFLHLDKLPAPFL